MTAGIAVSVTGAGPRVVLVHGAMTSAGQAWAAQAPLAARWTLVAPTRRGFHPNPPADLCDFDVDAADIAPLLENGAHLVGHSYGGLVAALIAARRPEHVHSLTLIEPALHALALDDAAVQDSIARYTPLTALREPEQFLPAFLDYVGVAAPPRPGPLRPITRQHVLMAINERLPWTAVLPPPGPLEAQLPTMLLTGGSAPVVEAIADAVEQRYANTRRHLVAGAPHAVQSFGEPVNELLEAFWLSAAPTS